ncbi:sensor histidine kinase [Paenibacillus tarimensis]|uniref:sensor histidine kinase n=1 Tax=Paenibacillus tarimensis TaxID=416012 RepID=UPI001F2A72A7|nr:histidine kinase [Paenibacillus tarimensis]MCF2943026.1 histidine kinase [Paenibacillus tarimensis]
MPPSQKTFDRKRFSFSTKLVLMLSAANLIIFSTAGFVTYQVHLSFFNKEVSRQYQLTTEQVLARLDARVRDMYRITDYITLNPSVKLAISGQQPNATSYERMVIEKALNEELHQVRLDAPEIMGIRIYDLKGNVINLGTMTSLFYQLDPDFLKKAVSRLEGTSGEYVWMPLQELNDQDEGGVNGILAGRLMRSIELDTYGMMVILFNSSLFESYLKDLRVHEDINAYLYDSEGRLLYTLNREKDGGTELQELTGERGEIRSENGVSYLYTQQQSDKVNFTLVSKVSLKQIQSRSWVILQVAVISALASIFFSWIIITLIGKRLLRPLNSLVFGMKRVRDGAFHTRVDIKTRDELGFIGESFNQMAGRIETLIREVYQRELSEKEAELKAIQAQLNPHFLYNTLGMFFWKFYVLGDEASARLVNSLSEMLQYTLEPAGKLTTLGDEVRQMEHYFNIQKARYEGALFTTIDIPDDLLDSRVIRLLLQPIAENAFVHAFINKKTDRNLTIRGWRKPAVDEDPDYLMLEISDNGCGMDEETLRRLHIHTGIQNGGRERIGISSVRRRIALIHGDPYGMELRSPPGHGTTVLLRLPYHTSGG